jgi:hypothetical protein
MKALAFGRLPCIEGQDRGNTALGAVQESESCGIVTPANVVFGESRTGGHT